MRASYSRPSLATLVTSVIELVSNKESLDGGKKFWLESMILPMNKCIKRPNLTQAMD